MSHDYNSYNYVGSKISIKNEKIQFYIPIYDNEVKI